MMKKEIPIEDIVSKLLIKHGFTISVAESCTGGMLSATLINYPGISEVFMEGCITYSNEAKIARLGVSKNTLDEYGAVSEQTAREMAYGMSKQFNTDVALSTTGIAGPGGGSDEKPVGLVYTGIYINGQTTVYKNIFTGSRLEIRKQVVEDILNNLRLKLEE